jgi:Leucine-rich repeat (LRR) protein
LRVLIINYNHLNELLKEIGLLRNLLYLDIGNNGLKTVPEEIGNLTKLHELHIDDNSLNDIEKEKIKSLLPNCNIYFK